jgi:predicted small secreted protein
VKIPYKLTAVLLLASALVAVFSADCGTISGFGNDVETVGNGIEKSTR